jgi:predicted DNA-binding transcriptional regulator AlpA
MSANVLKGREALIRLNEAAALARVKPVTFREWVKKGIAPKPIRHGRLLFFTREQIAEFLAQRQTPGPEEDLHPTLRSVAPGPERDLLQRMLTQGRGDARRVTSHEQ